MTKQTFFGVVLFSFVLIHYSFSQTPSCPQSKNKKSVDDYNEAEKLYKAKREYDKARELVQKSLDEDPDFADAWLLSGRLAMKKRDYKNMEEMLTKAIELCENIDPDAYYQLGWLQYDEKKYKEASKVLKRFLEFDKINENDGKHADTMLVRCRLYLHPVPFDPQPVPGVSTPAPEYLPCISPDDEFIFFTRRYDLQQKGNIFNSVSVEKFMFAQRTNGVFDKGKPLDWPFNLGDISNEGGGSITIDNHHIYFTVNKKGNFDICVSDWINGSWDSIINLGPAVNDPKQWDSQPSIAPDGNTLYFASARDSLTGLDIYVTHKDERGKWSKAVKLPAPINTAGNEKTPFIHPDGKTLYFSSDNIIGLGGYDIYKSQLDDKGNWSEPVNLGYPINTEGDEVGFFVSTDGKTGYFASNKIKGSGYDIYYFPLYPQARPDRVYMQKGSLKADNSDEPVSATIEITNTKTKQMRKIPVDSVTGQYAFVTDFKNDLLLTFKKDGYAFEDQYISAEDTSEPVITKRDIMIQKIELGKQYTINDVRFATNSYEINNTINSIMDAFAEYLNANPRFHVVLQGHTDNVGSDQDNVILSENRAKTIYNYLIAKGIGKSRLSYKGYGASKPIADNSTEEGRARNRRTVFVVTAK
jgi:outer membrane protein OmpA-like peptidoglycan-associated protein